MSTSFNEKTVARRLSEMTGRGYQKCLTALRTRNLGALHPNPAGSLPADIVDVAVVAMWESGDCPTPKAAKVALLTSTVTQVVQAHHPDAISIEIWMGDDEYPAVGRLWRVSFVDGSELDSAYCEPVGDAAMVWVALLGDALELGCNDYHTVHIPSAAPGTGAPAARTH